VSSFVIDASIALGWLMEDEDDAYAVAVMNRLRDGGAVTPALFEFEVANALVVAERRQRITASDARKALWRLQRMRIETEWFIETERIFWLARRTGLTAYDAAYLEVAERLEIPLATSDQRLRAAAATVGVPLLS
jgi:predicted nucleic acid-binding protein